MRGYNNPLKLSITFYHILQCIKETDSQMQMKGILTHEYNIPPSQNTNTSGIYLVMTVAQTTSMWSQTNPGYCKQVLTTDLQCWVVFDFDEDHPVLVLENALEWFWFQVRFLEKLNPDSNLGVFLFFFNTQKEKSQFQFCIWF
jgi:hypothetical protein